MLADLTAGAVADAEARASEQPLATVEAAALAQRPALDALAALATAWWLREPLPHSGSRMAQSYQRVEHALAAPAFKRDEAGLHDAARRLGVGLAFVDAPALAAVQPLCPTRSALAEQHAGAASVAEGAALAASLPVAYALMHEYQQRRVLIFLDPEADALSDRAVADGVDGAHAHPVAPGREPAPPQPAAEREDVRPPRGDVEHRAADVPVAAALAPAASIAHAPADDEAHRRALGHRVAHTRADRGRDRRPAAGGAEPRRPDQETGDRRGDSLDGDDPRRRRRPPHVRRACTASAIAAATVAAGSARSTVLPVPGITSALHAEMRSSMRETNR